MALPAIDPSITSALQSGVDSLKQQLADGYKSLGIDQSTPITGGTANNGTAVSQNVADQFNRDLAGGLLPQSSNSKSTGDPFDYLDPAKLLGKMAGSVATNTVNNVAGLAGINFGGFSFGRVVAIGLGFLLIGGGIILFAGEDIIGTVKKIPQIAELGA